MDDKIPIMALRTNADASAYSPGMAMDVRRRKDGLSRVELHVYTKEIVEHSDGFNCVMYLTDEERVAFAEALVADVDVPEYAPKLKALHLRLWRRRELKEKYGDVGEPN